jgi:hypothetical protein
MLSEILQSYKNKYHMFSFIFVKSDMKKETLPRILQKYEGSFRVNCGQLYANRLENTEVDKFLDSCKLLKFNHKGTENLNKPRTNNKVSSRMECLPTPSQKNAQGNFAKHLNK